MRIVSFGFENDFLTPILPYSHTLKCSDDNILENYKWGNPRLPDRRR